jgi:hypothetical protein
MNRRLVELGLKAKGKMKPTSRALMSFNDAITRRRGDTLSLTFEPRPLARFMDLSEHAPVVMIAFS